MTQALTRVEAEEFDEYQRRAKRSPWLFYPINCVPAILPWHLSTSDYRVLAGANDIGKTTAGAFEMVCYATGYNPIRKESYQTPNTCWAVCVEYKSAGNVMLKKLSEMLPRKADGSRNWRYNKQDHIIKLGAPWYSEIAIKSQKEGESSLLGERCTAIWVDEAMGGDTGNENFGELQARQLPDQPLKMYFTLTPKIDTGIEWMRRKLWLEPGHEPHEDFINGTFCIEVKLEDCLTTKGGYITPEVYETKVRNTSEEEKDARLYGKWSPFATRPAFSYKFLMQCMERAPAQEKVKFMNLGLYSRPKLEVSDDGPGRLLRPRETAHNYIVAWDPSSGLGKKHDPSALVVFDRGDLHQVYHARCTDVGPEIFYRDIALPAAQYFNEAILVIESNGEGGGAAIQAARDSGYNNLYIQKAALKASGNVLTDRLGWNTNEQSRSRMIDALVRALTENKWTPSKDLLEEMSHIVKKPQPSGRYRVEHADGYHDDLVMAAGIALAVHYEEPVYEYPDFSSLAPQWAQPGVGGVYTRITGGSEKLITTIEV